MDKALVRLEVLKLVHTYGKPAKEVLALAREYENFIAEPQDIAPKSEVTKHKKVVTAAKVTSDNSLLDQRNADKKGKTLPQLSGPK